MKLEASESNIKERRLAWLCGLTAVASIATLFLINLTDTKEPLAIRIGKATMFSSMSVNLFRFAFRSPKANVVVGTLVVLTGTTGMLICLVYSPRTPLRLGLAALIGSVIIAVLILTVYLGVTARTPQAGAIEGAEKT